MFSLKGTMSLQLHLFNHSQHCRELCKLNSINRPSCGSMVTHRTFVVRMQRHVMPNCSAAHIAVRSLKFALHPPLRAAPTRVIQPALENANSGRSFSNTGFQLSIPETEGVTNSAVAQDADKPQTLTPSSVTPIPVCIVGGSGEIGSAIARAFAAHPKYPFHVTLLGRSEHKLQAALDNLAPSRNAAWPHTMSSAISQFQQSDTQDWLLDRTNWAATPNGRALVMPAILVNCAGAVSRSLFSAESPTDIHRINNTNLMLPMITSQLFGMRWARRLRAEILAAGAYAQFTPSIVNIGSLLGQQGGRGAATYAATKAGLMGLTRALAAEYGPMGIRVNAVNPGFIESPMALQEGLERIEKLRKRIPVGRLGRPEEVADAVVFLALNNYANNCVINLDGGLSAVGLADNL